MRKIELKVSVLPEQQKRLFMKFKQAEFIQMFYLAGGTGLALQIGHRQSLDFDFFLQDDINPDFIAEKLRQLGDFQRLSESENAIHGILDDVMVSFMTCKYKLLDTTFTEGYLQIAGMKDIACMKLSAITHRGSRKDFIDLYFLLQVYCLEKLFNFYEQKFMIKDYQYMLLKSLVYFEDAEKEPMPLMIKDVNWTDVKSYIVKTVKDYGLGLTRKS